MMVCTTGEILQTGSYVGNDDNCRMMFVNGTYDDPSIIETTCGLFLPSTSTGLEWRWSEREDQQIAMPAGIQLKQPKSADDVIHFWVDSGCTNWNIHEVSVDGQAEVG